MSRVVRRGRRGLDVEVGLGEKLLVASRQLVATGHEPSELPELRRAEGALDVGDARVRRELGDLVEPGAVLRVRDHAVRSETAQPRRELERVGRDRATFAGRDRLHGVEREHACVGVSRSSPRDRRGWTRRARARRPRSRPGAASQRAEVDRQPGVVHRDERVATAEVSEIQVERLRVDVDERRLRLDPQRAARARDERER